MIGITFYRSSHKNKMSLKIKLDLSTIPTLVDL